MHDIRAIRANASAFDAALARRGLPSASAEILARDAERRAAQTALQERQARRNALSREIAPLLAAQMSSRFLPKRCLRSEERPYLIL